jgi:hypothetical protein
LHEDVKVLREGGEEGEDGGEKLAGGLVGGRVWCGGGGSVNLFVEDVVEKDLEGVWEVEEGLVVMR